MDNFTRNLIGISIINVIATCVAVFLAPSHLVAVLFAGLFLVVHFVGVVALAVHDLRREFGQVI